MRILIYSSLIFAVLSVFGSAKEWTKFRGPSGDGHVTVKSIPLKWSETENIKWKVSVPGKGWASPVISADKSETNQFGTFTMKDTDDRSHEAAGASVLEKFFPKLILISM